MTFSNICFSLILTLFWTIKKIKTLKKTLVEENTHCKSAVYIIYKIAQYSYSEEVVGSLIGDEYPIHDILYIIPIHAGGWWNFHK